MKSMIVSAPLFFVLYAVINVVWLSRGDSLSSIATNGLIVTVIWAVIMASWDAVSRRRNRARTDSTAE